MTNEAHCGILVWGKRRSATQIRVENAWPAIVDRETFIRVQAVLKSRGPRIVHPRRTVSEYLLSGIIKCGTCGKAMSGHSAKSGQFFYYRCANATKRGAEECPYAKATSKAPEEIRTERDIYCKYQCGVYIKGICEQVLGFGISFEPKEVECIYRVKRI